MQVAIQFVPAEETQNNSTESGNNTTVPVIVDYTLHKINQDTKDNSTMFGPTFITMLSIVPLMYAIAEPVSQLIGAIAFSTLGQEKVGEYGKVWIGAVLGHMTFSMLR